MKHEIDRRRDVLFDTKWMILLRRRWIFRLMPFVEFVLAAGSMAMGNVRPESDFDVIIGVRRGRIFTARFFAVLMTTFFGIRRKKLHPVTTENYNKDASAVTPGSNGVRGTREKIDFKETANKICLNHFVTSRSYALAPPQSPYWRLLYQHLVPVWGDHEIIQRFYVANVPWSGAVLREDLRFDSQPAFGVAQFLERILSLNLGNVVEKYLKRAQIHRIEKSLAKERGYKPRIIYSDDELEFHPDTRRIELFERGV